MKRRTVRESAPAAAATWALAGSLFVAVVSCQTDGPSSPSQPEPLGGVELSLATVPDGAACLRVSAAGSRTVTRLFALTPGEMKFVSDPVRPGLATAVLVGDPSKPGVYAVHTRIPANFKLEPHSHSEAWRIATVVSGVLYYSAGDKFDESKLKALGPGSLVVEPRHVPHFAMTKGEEVMLNIVGEGPSGTSAAKR